MVLYGTYRINRDYPMPTNAATEMKQRLRIDLAMAMKQRRVTDTAIIRNLIAALDNAEAMPLPTESASLVQHDFHAGSAEVERLALSADHVQRVILDEIAAREHAAAEFDRLSQPARAAALREEIVVARRYLAA
jgi:uncharacterized protein YqeY